MLYSTKFYLFIERCQSELRELQKNILYVNYCTNKKKLATWGKSCGPQW